MLRTLTALMPAAASATLAGCGTDAPSAGVTTDGVMVSATSS